MSTKNDLKKLAWLVKAKGDPKKDMPPTREKGIYIGVLMLEYTGDKSSKRARDDTLDISPLKKKPLTSADDKKNEPLLKPEDKKKTLTLPDVKPTGSPSKKAPHQASGDEGTSVNPGVVLGLKAFVSRVAELKADKQRSNVVVSVLEKELEGLKSYTKEFNIATEKLEKEMAKLRRGEVLTKKLAVDKFKASEEYKEAVEEAASSYFGEGFD
ncbi:hypothetical protein Acr_00g0089820 [Actinidia rufa]|uniref:Uncharacterized protein n=1 Tax=Actinidia rufa TaxID=165716 RepID=A0A7J0DZ76_9ERIC|nr:hypothetical protein Acr_00g0089820 [Actinidia rufa]